MSHPTCRGTSGKTQKKTKKKTKKQKTHRKFFGFPPWEVGKNEKIYHAGLDEVNEVLISSTSQTNSIHHHLSARSCMSEKYTPINVSTTAMHNMNVGNSAAISSVDTRLVQTVLICTPQIDYRPTLSAVKSETVSFPVQNTK